MAFDDLIAQANERLSVLRLSVDDHTEADIRVIAAFLDLFDVESGQPKDDLAFLNELRGRRARASLEHLNDREAGKTAAAEVTTRDDLDRVTHIMLERGHLVAAVADTYRSLGEDYRTGRRCMVCGLTKAQAAAANYDCVREC